MIGIRLWNQLAAASNGFELVTDSHPDSLQTVKKSLHRNLTIPKLLRLVMIVADCAGIWTDHSGK